MLSVRESLNIFDPWSVSSCFVEGMANFALGFIRRRKY